MVEERGIKMYSLEITDTTVSASIFLNFKDDEFDKITATTRSLDMLSNKTFEFKITRISE